MRWGRAGRLRGVAAVAAMVTMSMVPVTPSKGATTSLEGPAVYDVQVNQRLENTKRADGTSVRATSLRFYPEVLDVRRGDIIHFWGRIFLTPVVLLPPPWRPTTTGSNAWLAPENGFAHDLDDPWYFVSFDPDDNPPDHPRPSTKVNSRVIKSPRCGAVRYAPCFFPQNAAQLETADPAAPYDPIRGALGSGIRPDNPEMPTELFVVIDAAPGTTIYATMLSVIGQTLTINIVGDDAVRTDPASLEPARQKQIALDEAKAVEIDERYRNYSRRERLRRGVTRWHALAGVEEDQVSVLESYPKDLRIARGDTVRWHSALLPAQFHTVSMPKDLAKRQPLYELRCDPDGDAGAGPDQPTLVENQPVCRGGPNELEIELNPDVVYRSGDGVYDGTAGDFETSGIIGAAPSPAPGFAPYDVSFPVASSPDGFAYVCLLHPGMTASVRVGS